MEKTVVEDTFFQPNKVINCHGRLIDLRKPAIMGIVNLTPDSFFDGGNLETPVDVLTHVNMLVNNGADMVDIGGQSTRPGSTRVDEKEEWSRLEPALVTIRRHYPEILISVDTYYSSVAEKAVSAGASIINDISGGEKDPEMFSTIARLQVPYVLMHMQGTPETMQENPKYINVISEVMNFFAGKVKSLRELGVKDIILDPGFGFGKTNENNFQLLKNLRYFDSLNCPLLVGMSRKSMVTKVLNTKAAMALNGTTVLNTIALMNGASILRVHDANEAAEVRTLVLKYLDV
jgi:dihydropteroate synthase